MKKSLAYALALIALAVIVMIVNADSDTVNLIFTKLRVAKAVMYLVFMGLGVVVGILLR